ncbi:MAG: helix-turn-helix domain-containing protein [Planctomycetota bacterium]
MAKSNPTSRYLNRVLDRANSIVYFVDDQETLRFGNTRLAEWVQVELEQLKGMRVVFDAASHADEQVERVKGLCPPPELWEPESVCKSFWISRKFNGDAEFCFATGVRVTSKTGDSGVLVVADPDSNMMRQPDGSSPHGNASQQPADSLHRKLTNVMHTLRSEFQIETLAGQSPFAQRIRRQVQVASKSAADVLIHGPVGCGKEHLARCIHAAIANDVDAELAPIYCAIADPEVIQQRISDARSSMALNRSQRLVLLLLDVDRLSASGQTELLGFLELPGLKIQTLATASRPLVSGSASDEPFFRSQRLAHRISSMSIEMTPLHQRTEDIPLIAQAILEKENVRRNRQLSGFSDAALELLMEFEWPENTNQLMRVIEAAAKNCKTRNITEVDLPDSFLHAINAMRVGRPVEVSIDLNEYLASVEKILVERALVQARGNKTKAAKQLNISRPKLLRRLSQLGLTEFLSPISPKDSDQLDPSAFEELTEE